MDPAARGLDEHLDLQECSLEEYKKSLELVSCKDAIMDNDVFTHLKKITSYKFNNLFPQNVNRSDFAATRALNREALNILVEGYEGYAWLCQVAAEVYSSLEEAEKSVTENLYEAHEHNNIIFKGLCEQLALNYDTLTMRRFMDQQRDHGSWNPPEFYWQLMKNPTVISQMLKLYHEKPKDEFLACWFQDYIHQSRMQAALPPDLLTTEELSKLTSNFNVFTLRMSEEISKYLFKDLRTEFDDINPDNICQLFCYAENAYFYSQALLHFIIRWRPDFSGCRRLSQLLCKNVMNPPSYWLDINKREKEYSASQINLLMTNLTKYKKLYNLFRSICRTQVDGKLILQSDEVCEFYDSLKIIIDSFESYQTLLYEREKFESLNNFPLSMHDKSYHDSYTNNKDLDNPPEHVSDPTTNHISTMAEENNVENLIADPSNNPERLSTQQDIALIKDSHNLVDMPSASQYGGDNPHWQEYKRMRTAPELPPMEALRESSLLERLLEDFVDDRIHLTQSQAWVKYAELLIILTVYTPYEMLLRWEESKQMDKAAKQGYHGLWKYDFLDEDSESIDDDTYYYDENGEPQDNEMLDNLFEMPEHHLPGSSFRDPTYIRTTDDLNYYKYPESSNINNKHHLPEMETIKPKRRRWDAKIQPQTTSTYNETSDEHHEKIGHDPALSDTPDITSSDTYLSSVGSVSVSPPSDNYMSSDSNSDSNSVGNYNQKFQDPDDSNSYVSYKEETQSEMDNSELAHKDSNRSNNFQERYYRQNFGSGKRAPPYYGHNNAPEMNDFNYTNSQHEGESEHESHLTFFTESESSNAGENYYNRKESPSFGRGKIPALMFNGKKLKSYSKNSSFRQDEDLEDNDYIDNDEDEMNEGASGLNPSELVSSIYKDALTGKKLGINKSLTRKKRQRLKEMFKTFKEEYIHYSNIARKELFEIYKITRDKSKNINVKIHNFQSLLRTNIAASAAIKYIEYYLFHVAPDPLAALSDSILLLLKMIADYHAPQIVAILLLLRKNFESGTDSSINNFNNLHSNKRSKIITFFIYLCRFENEYISVMTIVIRLVDKMDKSMIRAFLILLLDHCGPPYSSEFCRPLFSLLKKCVKLSVFDINEKESTVEKKLLRKTVIRFLEDAKHTDQPKSTPPDIISSIEELLSSIDDKKV